LESLVGNAEIRDINPTTKRLVERCLGGDWCVQLRKTTPIPSTPLADLVREDSPGPSPMSDNHLSSPGHTRQRSLKLTRSVENLRLVFPEDDRRGNPIRKASTDSSKSLPNVVAMAQNNPSRHDRNRASSDDTPPTQDRPPVPRPIRNDSMGIYETTSPQNPWPGAGSDFLNVPPRPIPSPSGRRSAPPVPPPVKRRKPPAVPAHRPPRLGGVDGGGKNMATIGPTITSSPLSQNF